MAIHRHPPLHTVNESQALRGDLPGAHIKNLFLRDKKRNKWLVTVPIKQKKGPASAEPFFCFIGLVTSW